MAAASAFSSFFTYIHKDSLNNLYRYQYHGSDKSIVAKYLGQPFWSYVVELMPRSVAPNMLTLIGFVFMVIGFVLQYTYCPELMGEAPSWVYNLLALFLFFYQTLDAIDGKQARRTNTAGPMGELFDHGCDAVTTTLLTIGTLTSMQVGGGVYATTFLLIMLTVFYVTQWDEYHTATLELWYLNVTEAQLFSMSMWVATGHYGIAFWLQTVQLFGFDILYRDLILVPSALLAIATGISSIWRVFRYCQDNDRSFLQSLSKLTPVVLVIAVCAFWSKHSIIDVMHSHIYTFLLIPGFLIPNLVGRTVVKRVCREELNVLPPLIYPLVIPVVIGVIAHYIPSLSTETLQWLVWSERVFVGGYAAFSLVAYLVFALSVIHSISTHLHIPVLRMPTPAERKESTRRREAAGVVLKAD